MFVPKSNGVHQLVHGDTRPVACDAAVVETQLLGASIGRHATISTYAAPAPIVCFFVFLKSYHYGSGNIPSIDSIQIPGASLCDLKVVGVISSRNKTNAGFCPVLVHSVGDDLSLGGSFSKDWSCWNMHQLGLNKEHTVTR